MEPASDAAMLAGGVIAISQSWICRLKKQAEKCSGCLR
jgi:hypothetical protein